MPSDRLKELQRQRALAQEQVAWLDREIARETGLAAVPLTSVTGAQAPAPPSPINLPDPSPADAERIIEQYQSAPGSLHSEVRRGCFLYFTAAFVLLLLGLAAIYLLQRLLPPWL